MEVDRLHIILFALFVIKAVVVSSDVNLALGRPATQSTTYDSLGGLNASKAVDGNNDTNLSNGHCSSTYAGAASWWMVDLGQPFRVRSVVVANRADCCAYRMDYFIAGITNSTVTPVRGTYPLCNQYQSTAPTGARLTLECDPDTNSGRVVIIQEQITGEGYLTMCEVEIYAGNVTPTHAWKRHCDQRLQTSSPGVNLTIPSAPHCVYECDRTIGCDSINYQPAYNSCVLNFEVYGATPGDLVNATGWIWWSRKYEFV